jgi:hypothetical protein
MEKRAFKRLNILQIFNFFQKLILKRNSMKNIQNAHILNPWVLSFRTICYLSIKLARVLYSKCFKMTPTKIGPPFLKAHRNREAEFGCHFETIPVPRVLLFLGQSRIWFDRSERKDSEYMRFIDICLFYGDLWRSAHSNA